MLSFNISQVERRLLCTHTLKILVDLDLDITSAQSDIFSGDSTVPILILKNCYSKEEC